MGAARLIEDGVTGIVVEAGNVIALAEALQRMEADRELRIEGGRRAIEAAKPFEYRIVSQERADLLRKVAATAP